MKLEPYSYRDDPTVPDFDDTVPLIIFDGNCVICSEGVQWLMERDPMGLSKMAPIQHPLSQAIYRHYNLEADSFDTFMVLKDGRPFVKWSGSLAAARTMPAPWSWLGYIGRIVPNVIGDQLYDIFQRNRIRWFGARQTCFVPNEAQKNRFLMDA